MSIAFVNKWSGGPSTAQNSSTVSLTSPTSTLAGDTIVVVVALTSQTPSVLSVTDSTGTNVYSLVNAVNATNGGTKKRVEVWACVGAAAASSVTVQLSGTTTDIFRVIIGEYSGVGAVGLNNTAHGTTSGTGAITIAESITAANNWIVAGFCTGGGSVATANTGNLRLSVANGGGTVVAGLGDNTAASVSSVSCKYTTNSTDWGIVSAELQQPVSGDGTALPAGVTAASAEDNPIGMPGGVASGETASSAEADPVGAAAGVPSGLSATSAENNPTATGTGNASLVGQSAVSAEDDPRGAPAGVPLGQSAASAENGPSGLASGLPAGQSASAGDNNPLGAPYALPTGVTVAAAENNPTAVFSATGLPNGVNAVAAENDPTSSGTGNVSVSGVTAATAENNPVGMPGGVPAGQAISAATNSPSATGTAVAFPTGVTARAAENNPLKEAGALGGGIAWPYPPLSTRHWSAPPSSQVKIPNKRPQKPVSISAVAHPLGVSCAAKQANPTAVGNGHALPHLLKNSVASVGETRARGNAKARISRHKFADQIMIAEVGRPRAKGIRNPTDEELLMLISELVA